LITWAALALDLFGDLVEREPIKELPALLGIVTLTGTELAQEPNGIGNPHLRRKKMNRLPIDFA
jgi:hypothetical protein